jgi:hypothetical protein
MTFSIAGRLTDEDGQAGGSGSVAVVTRGHPR